MCHYLTGVGGLECPLYHGILIIEHQSGAKCPKKVVLGPKLYWLARVTILKLFYQGLSGFQGWKLLGII